MPKLTDNKGSANVAAAVAADPNPSPPASAAGTAAIQATGGTQALAVRDGSAEEALPKEEERDTRLDHLAMQLDVLVKVHSFRVQDLLSMEKGTVVETEHEHAQDVPLRCGGALLMWSEFEVLDQQLAVRVTRLA
ncbi:MAG: FliM/FliN family flagellar motor C-terminal domain-containing protein [Acidobacteriaceae bacterium]|jgi:flagellar motor switch protein FliM